MKIVQILGFIFLALYLILTGVVGLAAIPLPFFASTVLQVLAVVSGVLILLTVGKCACDKCQ